MKTTTPFRLLLLFAFLAPLGCATTLPLVDAEVTVDQVQNPVIVSALAPSAPAPYGPAPAPAPVMALKRTLVGTASFYHSFFEGRTTANGQTFSNEAMTAASRTLDFGTRVRVTNLRNAKSVVVTINDRGPYVDGRIIDLSRRAANTLGFVHEGLTRVRVDIL